MAVIRKEQGELVSIAFLIRIIGDVVKFLNVGKSMNDLQLTETARLILNEFYFLKVADLQIFFNRFKTGQTGQLFDRLDGQVIMFKLREYCEERILIAESLALDNHKEVKQSEQQESYYVKIDDNYLREDNEMVYEESHIELATKYSFLDAIKVKNGMAKKFTEFKFKIVHSTKSDIGLIDYLKEKKPELAKEIEDANKHKELVRTHTIQMAQIEASNLSELEKENKKRGLSGLLPITQYELDMRKEMYKTTQ